MDRLLIVVRLTLTGFIALAITGWAETSGLPAQAAAPDAQATVTSPPISIRVVEEGIGPARLAGFISYYAPSSDTPDHELSWTQTKTGPLRQVHSMIRRHDVWVRRESTDQGSSLSESIHLPTGVVVSEVRSPDGDVRFYSVRAPDADTGIGITYSGRPTGTFEDRLGERCEEHLVYSGERFQQMACVTSDGISVNGYVRAADGEAWPYSFASATHLARQPVPLSSVLPGQFSRDAWLGTSPADAPELTEDYTVLLEAPGRDSQYLMRRRQGWTGEEVRSRDGSVTISAADREHRRMAVAWLGQGGRLAEVRYSRNILAHREGDDIERLDRPDEVVLGLPCKWYDVMPNAADVGRYECRTLDGMPLHIQIFGRGQMRVDVTAVRYNRQQAALTDLLPPEPWSSPQTWGVPITGR